MKKTEQLAIAGIRAIAEKLREERNDALVLLQVLNQDQDRLLRLLAEARDGLDPKYQGDLLERIEAELRQRK